MKKLHIEAVEVVEGGVVVTYDDASCAFYEEEVLMTHLGESLEKKGPARAMEAVRATRERRA